MKPSYHKLPLRDLFSETSWKYFSLFFFLLFTFELFSEYIYPENPLVHYVAKPLIMISLAVFFLWQARGFQTIQDVWLFMGLILSLFGDIFLMFSGDTWFMLGLGSFLFAHIAYIVAFASGEGRSLQDSPRRLGRRKPWLLAPFLIYGFLLVWVISPGLGALKVPVYVYASVITLMAIAALNRWRQISQYSFAFVFLGALLFVISDSVLAINKFAADRFPIPLVDYWIMSTYMAAQYLIVIGMLLPKWEENRGER